MRRIAYGRLRLKPHAIRAGSSQANFHLHGVPEWFSFRRLFILRRCRNWQTSQTKDLVAAMSCGFKSHSPQKSPVSGLSY